MASSIYVPESLFPQLLSEFSLVYLLAWHPSLHTPYISSPNHCLLFAEHAHTIAACFAVVPKLCYPILVFHSSLYLEVYLAADHSPLCQLKCYLIFLSYGPGLTFMQHTTSHTTAVQSPSINDIYLLVSNGTNCLNLFHPIQILVSTAASAYLSTLNMSPK